MNIKTNLMFLAIYCCIFTQINASSPGNPPTTPMSPHRLHSLGRQPNMPQDISQHSNELIKSTHHRQQSHDERASDELLLKMGRKGHKRSFSQDDSKDENGNNSFIIEEEEPGVPVSRARSASSALPEIASAISALSALLDDKDKVNQLERILVSAHDTSKNVEKSADSLHKTNIVQLVNVSQNYKETAKHIDSAASKAVGGALALAGAHQIINNGPDILSLGLFGAGLAIGDFPAVRAAGKSVKENWHKPLNNVNWSWISTQLKRCLKKTHANKE